MVCQCLALIMGFVSVCLRKRNARVRLCVLARERVCVRLGTGKTYLCAQVIIFWRVYTKRYLFALKCFCSKDAALFFFGAEERRGWAGLFGFFFFPTAAQLHNCGMGSWVGTSVRACMLFYPLSVKVVK